MGGFATWALLAKYPDLAAAAVPICGGGKAGTAANFKDVPSRGYHGAKDQTVPQKMSDEMVEALKKAGGKPEYTVFPDAAHDSWTAAYGDRKALPVDARPKKGGEIRTRTGRPVRGGDRSFAPASVRRPRLTVVLLGTSSVSCRQRLPAQSRSAIGVQYSLHFGAFSAHFVALPAFRPGNQKPLQLVELQGFKWLREQDLNL